MKSNKNITKSDSTILLEEINDIKLLEIRNIDDTICYAVIKKFDDENSVTIIDAEKINDTYNKIKKKI